MKEDKQEEETLKLIVTAKELARVAKEKEEIRLELVVTAKELAKIAIEKEKYATEIEEKFKGIFDNTNDSIFIHNLNGKILEVNNTACKKLGYTKKELLLLSPKQVDSPKFAKNIPLRIREVLRNGSSIFETVHITKSGEEIPTEVNAKLIEFGGQRAILSICRDITERKKTEEKLKESEEKYHNLYNTLRDAFVKTDMSGKIVDFNEEYANMIGYKHDEIKKLTYLGLTPSKWHNFEKNIIKEEILKKGYSKVYEKEYLRKDGTIFPVELKTFLIKDNNGNPAYMWAIIRDITERKKIEEELKARELLLNETSKMAHVGGWEFDVKTLDLKWSKETYRIHEVQESSFHPTIKGAINFYTSNSKPIIEKAVNDAIKNNKPFDLELEIITAKKNHRWVHALGKAILGPNGSKKISGTFQDITEKRTAEEELRNAKENVDKLVVERTAELEKQTSFLSSVLENIPDMVFVKDAKDLKFELFNKAGEELLGQKRSDLLGKNDYNFFPKKQADFFTEKDRDVLRNKKLLDIPEEPIKTTKGERILHTKKIPILDKKGEPIYLLGISEDITEQKKFSEDLKQRNLELERFNQVAIDRELKMVELKKKIKQLESKKEQ